MSEGPHADQGHGHSHSHDHALFGGWSSFGSHPALRAVLGVVVTAAIVTVIGLIALWPSADGQDAARSQGSLVGLGSERYAATVSMVLEGPCSYSTEANPAECRTLTFVVDEGPFAGESHTLSEADLRINATTDGLELGDDIIAGYEPSTEAWFYGDLDRRGSLTVLALLFAAVVIALGRFRGVLALAAMVATVVVLVFFVAPSVLDGNDPLLVAVVAAAAIAFVSLYLTHGFNPTTTVALAGTLIALLLTLALASFFFSAARFTGLASEEALLLPFIAGDIDLTGLLLGGAILGTLGALDDVTVTQVATVSELRHRSPDLPMTELVKSGIRVGREHIASTVNTLLLAYAGASMPLLLLFAASEIPLDKIANAELIAIEIVRTLSGSIGLVAAVPITTVLAALVTSAPAPAAELTDDPSDDAGHADVTDDTDDTDEPAASSHAAEPSRTERTPAESSPDDDEAPVIETGPEPSWDDFAPRADDEPF